MSRHPNWIAGVKKIAVLRANALGDYIFAQPALYALRTAYPQAEIVYLGKSWHADYLSGRPGPVDRVVVIPRYKGVGEDDTGINLSAEEQRAQNHFFHEMVLEGFDLALQMHGGGGNSNPFVQRMGARITAGMRASNAPPLDRWMPYLYWQHETLRLLELVGLIGAPPVTLETLIEVTNRDLSESCQAVPEQSKPIVVLHPGASDARRRWSAKNFARTGETLAREGYLIAVVGTAGESSTVDDVLSNMHEPAWNLCGMLSLHGLTGLLRRAVLVIANDSGPRHLAEAVGTPTIGIYWCGNLINAGSHFRTLHRPQLSWRLNCPVCGKNTIDDPCDHRTSFVDDVKAEAVLESAREILETTLANPLKNGLASSAGRRPGSEV